MAKDLVIALNYGYPITLCAALMVFRLAMHRRNIRFQIPKAGVRHALFALQCLVLCSAMASCIVDIWAIIGQRRVFEEYPSLLQAELTSFIAIALFFATILLPTPGEPFAPDPAMRFTWLIAAIYETAILISGSTLAGLLLGGPDRIAVFALAILRAITLLVMVTIHRAKPMPLRGLSGDTDDETSPLLLQGKPGVFEATHRDAQSMGWLDYFYGFGVFLPYIWPSDSRKHQLVAIFCFVLLALQRVVNILVPYQLEIVTQALSDRSLRPSQLALYIIYRGIQGQQGIIGSFRAILWIPISQSLFQRLSCDAFNHVLTLSLDFHLHSKVGEVIAALSRGSAFNTFFDGFVFQLFPMVLDLGVAATYVFIRFDAVYSLIIIGVLCGYIFVTVNMAVFRGRVRRQMADADRHMNAIKVNAIMAYETVHYNSAFRIESETCRNAVQRFQASEFSVLLSLNGLNVIQSSIYTVGIALVTIVAAYRILQGTGSVAIFVSLLAYFGQLYAPLAFFGSFFNQVQNSLVDAERMLELFTLQPMIIDQQDAVALSHVQGRVTFDHVSFAYNNLYPVLHDISFTVEPGTTTAIVGESGSGKSTCLKLLFRFYDVSQGIIAVDGIDIRQIRLKDLRREFGVVPQQQDLFHTTIENNVLYSNANASSADVEEVCRTANIHDRIMTFPDGYKTIVGERGLRLSGGEKQRIVLARALLKGSAIILLDEATASLDSGTEALIQNALKEATAGKTTIVVAHRLSTIVHASQILVLDHGRIVDRGTHHQLLQKVGLYSKMWDKQFHANTESLDGV